MRNRLNVAAAIAAVGLMGLASTAVAQDEACANPKISKKLQKPIEAVQKARDSKDWAGMLANAKAADAIPIEKTEYDKFWLHELQGVASANLKQYGDAVRELEAAFNSPCMPDAERPGRLKLLMQMSYQNKDYPKAIEFGKKAYEGGDPEVGIYVGNAYYIQEDYENTRTMMRDVIGKLETSGKVPEESAYRILQSACLQLKDDMCVVEQTEKLVQHHPKPKYWIDMTDALLRASKTDKELLNILRLADQADALQQGPQFVEMAQLAMAQGLPGEAQSTLEKGQKKGVFTAARDKDRATRLLADAKTAVANDQGTLDKQDASARAKPTGDADVKLGAAYLSYGQNDKAIEAIQRGLAKGGVKDTDEAGLLLGMAYLRSNNKAEADKAFQTVNKSPMMARIAKLWLLNTGSVKTAG